MNTEQGKREGSRVAGPDRVQTRRGLLLSNRVFLRVSLVLGISTLFLLHSSLLFADKDKDKDHKKHFGLIFGTAWGPDDRGLPGVKIKIHPVGKDKPHWELVSGVRGEFSQPVPPGPGDYVVTAQVEAVSVVNGVRQKKKKLRAEKTVHIMGEEREDVGLQLAE